MMNGEADVSYGTGGADGGVAGMMRPFYRSRLFWCGVPWLVVLLWGWWDSGRYDCFISYEKGGTLRELVTGVGCVSWTQVRYLRPTMSGTSHAVVKPVKWGRMEGSPDAASGVMRVRRLDFPRAYVRTSERVRIAAFGIDRQVDMVRVGMWVPVLGYVVLWLGGVVWWQCRKARVRREEEVC